MRNPGASAVRCIVFGVFAGTLISDIAAAELRPYRSRGEIGSWFRDQSVIPHLEDRLKRYRSEGWLFHMPGRWEFVFDIGAERLTHSVRIE